MGVEYRDMTYIGVYAGSRVTDAEKYLIAKGLLEEDELDEKYDGDIQAMYDMGFPLKVQCECYYSGEGWYIGFETHPSSYKDFDGLLARFKEITGDDGEVLSFTQVY